MSEIISDEELLGLIVEWAKSATKTPYKPDAADLASSVRKAQRDSSDKEWMETLRQFETLDADNKPYIHISPRSWQVLKQKLGGK